MQVVLHLIVAACLLLSPISGHPLCRSGGGAFNFQAGICVTKHVFYQPGTPSYCSMYSGEVCCSSGADSEINAAVDSIGVTGECATFMKQNLCAECDPWAIHLFDGENANAPDNVAVPYMCPAYCSSMYEACKEQLMTSNPYDSQRRDISIGAIFDTAEAFCQAFSHAEESYCYDGTPFVPPEPKTLNTSGAPDERIFVATKRGEIRIVNPDTYEVTGTYLDITSRVWDNSERGFLGLAFHPEFKTNGRFFVSYSCNPSVHADCRWPCERGCPWGAGTCTDGFCQMHDHMSIIAEYRAAGGDPSAATADPTEVQRIFDYTQPYGNHNGGQILFGPDGYLYLVFGDGGDGNDPQQNGQDRQSYLGKILRVDVDNKANGKNYAVPSDNPFVGNTEYLPEIYALGLRNPWRCSFDRSNGAYFFCGDVGQGRMEEVDLIISGGNYGWRRYEGTLLNFQNDAEVPDHIEPIMEYDRSESGNPASITGGYRYRGALETCMTDNYIFADLYDKVFGSIENPPGSGKFERRNLQVKCANDSPLSCTTSLGDIQSFGEDAAGEIYFLTTKGVAKIVEASRCNLRCDMPSSPYRFPSIVSAANRLNTLFNLLG